MTHPHPELGTPPKLAPGALRIVALGGLAEIVPHKKVGYITERDPEEIASSIAHFYENNLEKEFSNKEIM